MQRLLINGKDYQVDTSDEDFAKNPRAQLNFVYKKSPHYEKAHLLLPIFKVY